MSETAVAQLLSAKKGSVVHGWLWLTIPIVALMALASMAGVLTPDMYGREMPSWAAQCLGQDWFDLLVVVPALAISGWLAGRGSRRAELVWLGVLLYSLYMFIIYAFAIHFNRLFLVYVATLACIVYAILFSLRGINARAIQQQMAGRRSAKVTGIMLAVLGVMFYAVWLKDVIPAVATGVPPQSLIDNGLLTNPVHVLDMAIFLPGFILAGVGVWRGHPLGYLLAPAMLTFNVLMAPTVIVLAVLMAQIVPGSDLSVTGLFVVITLIALGLLVWYLRDLPD